LNKKIHLMTRAVAQKDEEVKALASERDSWKERHDTAARKQDKSQLQQMHLELQEKHSACQAQLADSNRERLQLRSLSDTAREELVALRAQVHDALVGREDSDMRLSLVSKDLALTQQACARLREELSQLGQEGAQLRIKLEDAQDEVGKSQRLREGAQRRAEQLEQLLDARSAELAEATHQLSLRKLADGGVSGGGSASTTDQVQLQLREDAQKLRAKIEALEEDQAM
jgi:hypothetical protein